MKPTLKRFGLNVRLNGVFMIAILTAAVGSVFCWNTIQHLNSLLVTQKKIFSYTNSLKEFEGAIYRANLLAMDVIVDRNAGAVGEERKDEFKEIIEYFNKNKNMLVEIGSFTSEIGAAEGISKRYEGIIAQTNKLIAAVDREEKK